MKGREREMHQISRLESATAAVTSPIIPATVGKLVQLQQLPLLIRVIYTVKLLVNLLFYLKLK